LQVAARLQDLASGAADPELRGEFLQLSGLYRSLARMPDAIGWAALPPAIALEGAIMHSSWHGSCLHYRRESILAHAPSAPGVYALWNETRWLHVGDSDDLRQRLLEHLAQDEARFAPPQACAWGFEFIESPYQRVRRRRALMQELLPANGRRQG
jgi:hypothetical protein